MGDLFQAWVGFRSFETADVAAVVAALRDLRAPGSRSTTSRGTATSSSPAAPTPTPSTASRWRPRSSVGGVRYLAVHGDGLNDRDWKYRFWRWLSKSAPVRLVVGAIPGALAHRLVHSTEQRLSQTNFKHRAALPGGRHPRATPSGGWPRGTTCCCWATSTSRGSGRWRAARCGCSTPGSGAGRWSGCGCETPRPMSLRVTMLGSGTSTGVPVIGCTCAGLHLRQPEEQALARRGSSWRWAAGSCWSTRRPTCGRRRSASACRGSTPSLFTHSHADHIFGLDDVRIFNFRQRHGDPLLRLGGDAARHPADLRLRLRGRAGGGRQAAARPDPGARAVRAAGARRSCRCRSGTARWRSSATGSAVSPT